MFYVQPRTEEQQDKAESRLLKRQDQRKRKLEEAGIKYDFEAVAYVSLSLHRGFSRHRLLPQTLTLIHTAEKEAQGD